jgi:hypothetical protein
MTEERIWTRWVEVVAAVDSTHLEEAVASSTISIMMVGSPAAVVAEDFLEGFSSTSVKVGQALLMTSFFLSLLCCFRRA